jgi:hydrogenase-4 component B
MTAVLYHCLAHSAFFKSLLFLCTGSVLHATTSAAWASSAA